MNVIRISMLFHLAKSRINCSLSYEHGFLFSCHLSDLAYDDKVTWDMHPKVVWKKCGIWWEVSYYPLLVMDISSEVDFRRLVNFNCKFMLAKVHLVFCDHDTFYTTVTVSLQWSRAYVEVDVPLPKAWGFVMKPQESGKLDAMDCLGQGIILFPII